MTVGSQHEGSTVGRVLLVDDDADVRRDYAKLLRSTGCTVETAADGREAIARLGAGFDLIVSDISMPQMSGTQFLRAVRERDLDIPVILMTGAPGLESAVEAVEHGAFRYLTKPVALDTLAQVVRRAIHMHALARLKREALALVDAQGMNIGDRTALEARFENALEQLWIAYQPIVSCSERGVFGYEALVRSGEPSLPSPADLFDAAERLDRLHDLGRTIRKEVARSASVAPQDATLFINVHTADLEDFELCSSNGPLAPFASRVVLEITERATLERVKGLGTRTSKLRQLGFRLAVDDLGAGYAGLTSLTQLEPEFVKLDRLLVRNVDASARKRSVIGSMLRLCGRELGMQVIAEGVETAAERDVLAMEGCDLQQGFLFAKPERAFAWPQF
jgi:EAL domain-containing protein (putative c-di-GMP-specific phosphodiesterase class I)